MWIIGHFLAYCWPIFGLNVMSTFLDNLKKTNPTSISLFYSQGLSRLDEFIYYHVFPVIELDSLDSRAEPGSFHFCFSNN